jgi:uncharacterized delta-60 repeat protein
MKVKNYTLLVLIALFSGIAGYSQPVFVDSTFNGTGRKIFSLGGTLDFGDNVAVQSDGKILMSGATFIGGLVKLGIVRMNADGSFDPGFGTAGISLIDCGTLGYQGGFDPEMIVRPDGKIIVCGSTQNGTGGDDMLVCRLLSNGQPDVTFGTGGTVAIDMAGINMMPDAIHAFAVDAAGNIYGCGSTRLGGTPFTNDLAVIKLTAAGVLDPAFSSDGKLLLDLSGSWDYGFGIAIQSDNKIVVSGYSGLPADFFAIRLNTDGSLDASYGDAGKTTVDIFGSGVADEVFGMTMAPDGKVYIVGDGYNSAVNEAQAAVVRLTTSGLPDPSFSTDGIATFDISPGNHEFFKDLIILSNGSCLVGGSIVSGDQDFSVFRMNPDGTLDLNFNSTGSLIVDVSGTAVDDLGYGMAMQSDGKILLSGNTSYSNAVNEKYSIIRLVSNGVLASFTASQNLICEGSAVQFTNTSLGAGLEYEWTFEGGTPATSTLTNPLVTYTAAGTFDVKLKVNNTEYADSISYTNMIEVIAIPAIPAIPSGPASICNLQSAQYTISTVPYATSYNWLLTPSSAGILTGNGTSASFTAASTWTGSYTIAAQAANQCGSSSWSATVSGTVFHLPLAYTLQGNDTYCEGTSGTVLTLSGSETGVSYQLLLDGLAFGAVVAGTGSALTWPDITSIGFYTVDAQTSNCTNGMAGQIYVSSITAPAQPAFPAGPAQVCSNVPAVYSVSGITEGDALVWSLTPSSAGTLTPTGNTVSISWAEGFTGNASLSVLAQNDCGNSPQSEALAVTVNESPAPVVLGLQTVCQNWSVIYEVLNNAGSSYNWTVAGGTIASGNGTNVITVIWNTVGNGSISVTETNSAQCIGTSVAYQVLVDICIGTDELKTSTDLQVFPNPAYDNLTLVFPQQSAGENTVRITDALGRIAFEQKLNTTDGTINLDVSSLKNGYYTLFLIKNGKLVMHTKVLKN